MKEFKPNLIPNNKDGFNPIEKAEQMGVINYFANKKKDGCRLQLIDDLVLGRSMKVPQSNLVVERFNLLAKLCEELRIAIDGEFYDHTMSFSEIHRFFKNSDVTREKEIKKLEGYSKQFLLGYDVDDKGDKTPIYSKASQYESIKEEYSGKKTKLDIEFPGRSIEWLSTFHSSLKFHLFDGIVLDRPDLTKYSERMACIIFRLESCSQQSLLNETLVVDEESIFHRCSTVQELESRYEQALEEEFEGLVLTHQDHEYKFGRNSLKQGTILKIKDDKNEYDGIILEVEEGTMVMEGVARTTNELGRSVTSKKKEDRELSGLAKGFLVEYEGLGTFVVGLRGFDNEAKRELLQNKDKYIGQHFKYTGMPPVKDFPRHAYFMQWRDSK